MKKRRMKTSKWVAGLLPAALLFLLPAGTNAQGDPRQADPVAAAAGLEISAVIDNSGYNVGETVRFRANLRNTSSDATPPLTLKVSIRYAGDSSPVLNIAAYKNIRVGGKESVDLDYRDLWPVPEAAKRGLYEVDVTLEDASSEVVRRRGAASFAVYRKRVRLEAFELDRAFYTSGDPVRARVRVENLTRRPVSGLRIEFSDRHWPWIVGRSGVVTRPEGARTKVLEESLRLAAKRGKDLGWEETLTAPEVTEPRFYQFVVVAWNDSREEMYDLLFSRQIIVRPANQRAPLPYHLSYMRQPGRRFDFEKARNFYPPEQVSAAIEISREHTMVRPGDTVELKARLRNTTSERWSKLNLETEIVSPEGERLRDLLLRWALELKPGEAVPVQSSIWKIPEDAVAGLYRLRVYLRTVEGVRVASSELEIAVNPLPKSILIFCAHEDDEGAHRGTIRAAVENDIPIHFVYFTSGDAGSCDRYYSRSCGPNEAREFGYIRMDETRKAMAHLGVPAKDIHFLGLPDGGSGEIWYNHLSAADPYLSVLMATDHAPYEGLHRPNLPYARKAVVEEAKKFILRYRPEAIYAGHPDERHVDHRTNNWFVVKALQELRREGSLWPELKLLVDQVYGARGENPAPYKYERELLYVSGEAAARGQEAFWHYQSQGGNRAEGRRRTFTELRRREVHRRVLDWQDHEGWNE